MSYLLNYLGLVALHLLALLPHSWERGFGTFIGWVAGKLPIKRRYVVQRNLELCFPELNNEQRQQLAKEHFILLGRSVAERSRLWLGNEKSIRDLVQIETEINPADGKPRVYVGMHMVGIEAGLIGLSIYLRDIGVQKPITLYVEMKNKFFDKRIKTWRERFGALMLLRKHNARELIREIRRGSFILLSPDMDLGVEDSVFVPFFGIETCTVTSISRFAQMGGAEVCPVVTTLNADGKTYTCRIGQAWKNFPSNDLLSDTKFMSEFFESQIRPRPAEYYWVHKRFKHRPEGEPEVY